MKVQNSAKIPFMTSSKDIGMMVQLGVPSQVLSELYIQDLDQETSSYDRKPRAVAHVSGSRSTISGKLQDQRIFCRQKLRRCGGNREYLTQCLTIQACHKLMKASDNKITAFFYK